MLAIALGYDAKGNIVTDGAYTYGYSSENLLTSLLNPTPGAIQSSSTYAYDPLMRLAVINSSNDGHDASLGYDGQDFVFEALSGNRTRRYVRDPGVDEPLVAYLTTRSASPTTRSPATSSRPARSAPSPASGTLPDAEPG